MSFYLARLEETSPGAYALAETRKIRLGGPDGPIARHVLSLSNEKGDWVFQGAELAEVLRPSEWENAPVWLVWRAPDEPPYRVSCIPGVSSEFTTEVMVQMEVLESTDGTSWRPVGKFTGEALRLTGGRMTPRAKWTWAAPKMIIGSTTVG